MACRVLHGFYGQQAHLLLYAAMYGMQAIVFIPAGKIALGKLGQALAYGAQTIQIDGDFDDAVR